MKTQETLEEVDKRLWTEAFTQLFPNWNNGDVLEQREQAEIKAFIQGAKWQQEEFGKSEFLQKLRATKSDAEARRLIFEQFKNK